AGGMLAFFSHDRLASQYEDQSLDVARAIAYAPAVRADVERYDATPLTPSPELTEALANGQLQMLATEVQTHAHLSSWSSRTTRASGCPIPTGTNSVSTSAPTPRRHW